MTSLVPCAGASNDMCAICDHKNIDQSASRVFVTSLPPQQHGCVVNDTCGINKSVCLCGGRVKLNLWSLVSTLSEKSTN